VIALAFAPLCVWLMDWPSYAQEVRAKSAWMAVPAKIISTDFAGYSVILKDPYMSAAIKYEYSVNEQDYMGTRIRFQDISALLGSDARDIMIKYPAGHTAMIKVDPAHPENSILDPQADQRKLWEHLAACWIIAGIFYLSFFPPIDRPVHLQA
jgi:Protein of unknown function (DUF3592)